MSTEINGVLTKCVIIHKIKLKEYLTDRYKYITT